MLFLPSTIGFNHPSPRENQDPKAVCNIRRRQRGQGNFELITNFDYVHEGQRTLAKVYVGAGSHLC